MSDSWKFNTNNANAGFYKTGSGTWTGYYASFFCGFPEKMSFEDMRLEVLNRAIAHHRIALSDLTEELMKHLKVKYPERECICSADGGSESAPEPEVGKTYTARGYTFRVDLVKDGEVYVMRWHAGEQIGVPMRVDIEVWRKEMVNVEEIAKADTK